MPSAAGQPITFIVPGHQEPAADATRGGRTTALPGGLTSGRVKHSVRVDLGRGAR